MRINKKSLVKRLPKIVGVLVVAVCTLAIVSCGKNSDVRKYKEKNTATSAPTPSNNEMPPSSNPPHFHWETPGGWVEDNTASGLRLATFLIKSEKTESICTVIPLQGDAGGLEANVSRWLDQIISNAGIEMDDNSRTNTLQTLLDKRENYQTDSRLNAVLIDFTPVTPKPADLSIIVSIIKVGDNNIFIKMSGEKSHLEENKEKFKTFCRSFSVNADEPSAGSTPPAPGNSHE